MRDEEPGVLEPIAFVTGASRGLGSAIARSLARAGHAVALGYRSNESDATRLCAELREEGRTALTVALDVAEEGSVDDAFATIEEAMGAVAVLVNNAGIVRTGLVLRYPTTAWDETIDTNLRGTFTCIRRALPRMLRSRWGRVINVASASAIQGFPGHAAYAASKAGVVGLTRTLAREIGSRGITVNAVCPGLFETDMTSRIPADIRTEWIRAVPAGRFGQPDEAAAVVAFLAGAQASYVNGAIVPVDGGLTA